MLRRTFTCSELCSRWDINTRDLTDIVNDGKLKASNGKYLLINQDANGLTYKSKWGLAFISSPSPLTVDDEHGFYFDISDVEAFERENGIKPPARKKSIDNKRMPKERNIFVYNEAKKLHHENPNINQAMARNRITILMKQKGYEPYCRTQFNRILKPLGFPPAPQGRKPAKKKE